ncbi:flippase-like domain-containing protein [Candidatus Woesearchaeota archaeon]|nr:flippase-like domain-containing protein [Candidatus Woesearchaeota archaeon]
MKLKKRVYFVLKWAIGLSILLYMLHRVGIQNVVSAFKNSNIFLMFIVLIIFILNFAISAYNIGLITSGIKKIKFWILLKYNMLSWGIGSFVPGKLGELSIVYLFKKQGIGYGQGLAISIMDKVITIFTLFLISILGAVVFLDLYLMIDIVIIFIGILVMLYFVIISNFGRKMIRKYILRSYASYFDGFSKTIKGYIRERKGRLMLNFVLTFIKWGVLGLTIWLLFLSFGVEVNYFYALLIHALVNIITLIPISISGVGVREASAVYFFTIIGVSSSIAAGVYLINLVLNYFVSVCSILLFSKELKKRKSLSKEKN